MKRFLRSFSGDLTRKMMVEMVVWSGTSGRVWKSDREECLLCWEKMKNKRRPWMSVAGQERKEIVRISDGVGGGGTCGTPKN